MSGGDTQMTDRQSQDKNADAPTGYATLAQRIDDMLYAPTKHPGITALTTRLESLAGTEDGKRKIKKINLSLA